MRTSRTRTGRRAALILTLGLAAAAGSATPGTAVAKTLPTQAAAGNGVSLAIHQIVRLPVGLPS